MKKLYIARHAKSDWSNPELDDFDRPLNKRGKRDVKNFVPLISKKIEPIDTLLTSGSNRTLKTARSWARSINVQEIIIEKKLYLATKDTIIDLIQDLGSEVTSLMIVGHNPGLTNFVQRAGYEIKNLPTSGILSFSCNLLDRQRIDPGLMNCDRFEYPKKYDFGK